MGFVDLHTHSTASDGTFAPSEVVRLAQEAGLAGLALTDHDTVAGLAQATEAARAAGLEFIAGIEISAVPPSEKGTLHILGYGIDPGSTVLAEMNRQLLEARDTRNPRIVQRLRELGIDITMEEVEHRASGTVIGRPHIAALLWHKGVVNSIKQAFDQYLGIGGKAYFDKERLPPRRALELIHQAGGLAVLAHAIQLRTTNDAQLDRVVKDLVDLGLDGIEVIHSDHDEGWVSRCNDLAKRYGLLRTGGSDFHGSNKADIQIGIAHGRKIPQTMMEALLARLQGRRGHVGT